MLSFTNLLVVMAIAFAAPLLLGLFPRVRLPVRRARDRRRDRRRPLGLGHRRGRRGGRRCVALLGLAFLLFLAGLEIEFDKLRGQVLRLTAARVRALVRDRRSWSRSGSSAAGLVDTPLLVAIILCATSLGVLVPVLKDAGEISSTFGQLIIAAASIADFGAIILLIDLLLGRGRDGLDAAAARRAVRARRDRASRSCAAPSTRCASARTCCACRTPPRRSACAAAFVLLVGFAALAETLGLEAILGAFIAGAIALARSTATR